MFFFFLSFLDHFVCVCVYLAKLSIYPTSTFRISESRLNSWLDPRWVREREGGDGYET